MTILSQTQESRRDKLHYLFTLMGAMLWLLGSNTLQAQQWQYVYGDDNARESGARGVTPVTGSCKSTPGCASCSTKTDGYISVGITDYPSSMDVYVVRTDNNGAQIWEMSYDISGSGSTDYGKSIIELSDGTGFVVVGSTKTGSNTDAFLMKIDCDGNEVWTEIYKGTATGNSRYSVGSDVIETTTGDGVTTNSGDLVVSGSEGTGDLDALLFRTNSTGLLLWNTTYDAGAVREDEHLTALIEATPINGVSLTGDIVAVGEMISSSNPRGPDYNGLILRVDGNNGSINAGVNLKQGIAEYGRSQTPDVFTSLVELQDPSETGTAGLPNVIVTGLGVESSMAGGVDNYLIKLDDGDPCAPLIQAYVGDKTIEGMGHDEAYDIVEISSPITGQSVLAQWNVAITGKTNAPSGGASHDAYILGIDPATLAPIAGAGNVYRPGSGSDQEEAGWSLDFVDAVGGRTQGFIMCGETSSDWLTVNDPQDLYLVKTDINLAAGGCEASYPTTKSTEDNDVCHSATTDDPLTQEEVTPDATTRDWGDEVCTGSSNGGPTGSPKQRSNNNSSVDLSISEHYSVQLVPNPVYAGEEISLLLEGNDLPNAVEIEVVNTLGEVVIPATFTSITSDRSLSINTEDWLTGTYFVTVIDGEYRTTLRMIIVE